MTVKNVNMDELRAAFSKAKANLVDFRHIMLANDTDLEVEPADFHYDWSDKLLHGTVNYAIQGFRESAKTNIVLRAFPLYSLRFPRRDRNYIVIIKKNSTLARNKLKEIEREYLSNPALSTNLVEVIEQSGERFHLLVKGTQGGQHDILIEAYGKGASVRGLSNLDRRPKIIIVDDPQDTEDATSEAVNVTDWNWFLSDVCFLGKTARIFLIGNNLGEKCIIERIMEAAQDLKEIRFETMRVPCLDDSGKSTWPSMYTPEGINQQKEDYRRLGKIDIWLREKMCLAIADETRVFRKEDFRYWGALKTAESRFRDCNYYMTVDPAVSTKDDADYRALVVMAVDDKNAWYIIDVSYGRYDAIKMIDEMFRLVKYHRLLDVGIEKGALKQAIEPFLMKEMQKRNHFFNVIPLEHGGKAKENRIRMLQPRFKAHTVWFPEDAEWLSELESELLSFTMQGTKGLHDDVIDALAYMEQIAEAPYGKVLAGQLPRDALVD